MQDPMEYGRGGFDVLIGFSRRVSQRTSEIEPKQIRRYEPWNNINHPINTSVDWSAAYVGIQQWLGIRAGRNCGTSTGDRDYSGAVGAFVRCAEVKTAKKKGEK